MHIFNTSATDLIHDITPKFAHSTKPAIIIVSLELNKLLNVGMGQNQKLLCSNTINDGLGYLLRTDLSRILIDIFIFIKAEHWGGNILRADHGDFYSIITMGDRQ